MRSSTHLRVHARGLRRCVRSFANAANLPPGTYGPGVKGNNSIDSSRPFHVTATFSQTTVSADGGEDGGAGGGATTTQLGALFDVALSQDAPDTAAKLAASLSPLVRDEYERAKAAASSTVHLFDPSSVHGSHSLDGQHKPLPGQDQVRQLHAQHKRTSHARTHVTHST
jgi:hypothetical protein